MTSPIEVSRGEIWQVSFGEGSAGTEITNKRPAVVVSTNNIDSSCPYKFVVPLTGWKAKHNEFPFTIKVVKTETNGLTKTSAALVMQVRSVAVASRFIEKLGILDARLVDEIVAAITVIIEFDQFI